MEDGRCNVPHQPGPVEHASPALAPVRSDVAITHPRFAGGGPCACLEAAADVRGPRVSPDGDPDWFGGGLAGVDADEV
jgi:hypothetical protein